jgi:hypothetical protein
VSQSEWETPAEVDPRLARAAEQVADATPVDWPDGEPGALSATLEGLRVLDSLARAHRQAGESFDARGREGAPRPPALFHWGPLEVLEPRGRGSFGEVFRAYDPALGREVALKLRHADSGAGGGTARWIEEARRLARIRHSNVLTVHGAGVFDGRAGLWCELVEGETLEQRLAREGPLGAREAAAIGLDLCAALAAVHAEGLVHGDLGTTNVMRAAGRESSGPAGSGRIVLMDFGSAHDPALDGAEACSLGTPLATAPEVLKGGSPTPKSDLYSLGVLLFRLASGRYPVEARTMGELLDRHARGDRRSLRVLRPDLPAGFVLAVERSLDPDPARRFAHAGEAEGALAAVLAAGARGAQASRRPFMYRSAAGAAVLLASLALVWAFRSWTARSGAPAGSSPADSVAARTGPVAGAPGAPVEDRKAGTPARPSPVAPLPLVREAILFCGAGENRTPLADGARLAVGDHLFLEIESRDSVSVYVLDEDRSGAVVVMFPVANVDVANPLAGGTSHRLPGRVNGRAFDWQVTSAGGNETFLIIASRHPLPAIERQVAALEHASPGHDAPNAVSHDVSYAALSARSLGDLRGVAGMVPAPDDPPAAGGGELQALARRLARAPADQVWTRLIRVANPGP